MQRPGPPNAPGYNPGFGGPMHPQGPMPPQGPMHGQGFVPMRRISGAGPCFGGPLPGPPQPPMQGAGCFMPAANIRKISNTMPPSQYFPNPN